uniref:Secreted protein n=1 Tax=Trichogramma kaykai TaxID=54128 RepID=A0ABD2VYG9_9HYME
MTLIVMLMRVSHARQVCTFCFVTSCRALCAVPCRLSPYPSLIVPPPRTSFRPAAEFPPGAYIIPVYLEN